MDDAAGNILASLGRVHLVDLTASEGLPSDSYKMCVSTLMQSLAQYSAAIIQLSPADGALLRSGLDSACYFFHQRGYNSSEAVHSAVNGVRPLVTMLILRCVWKCMITGLVLLQQIEQ